MRKLLAGCLFSLAALASCHGDSDSTPTSSTGQASSSQPAPAAPATKPLALTTDGTGLVQRTTPKGTIVHLQDRFQSAVVVRRNADGTLSTDCQTEQAGADTFMQGAAATRQAVRQ